MEQVGELIHLLLAHCCLRDVFGPESEYVRVHVHCGVDVSGHVRHIYRQLHGLAHLRVYGRSLLYATEYDGG